MSITARRSPARFIRCSPYKWKRRFSSLLFFLITIAAVPVNASGEISQLITRSEAATPSTVMVDGVSYQWGQGENLHLDGFMVGDDLYEANFTADSVSVRRRDIPGVAIGELCGVFAQREGTDGNDLKPDFPALADHPSSCDMSVLLKSSVINRGTLDIFSNTGPDPTNIERIDYQFGGGFVAPKAEMLSKFGHAIGEKHGNNRIQMAAILDVDDAGNPAEYGPLINVGRVDSCTGDEICYGDSGLVHDYTFFKSRSLEPLRDAREITKLIEPVAFAFLSLETLAVPAGSVYYGISVFPHDVDADALDLLDISSYPENTQEPEVAPTDSADIYGGSASLYIDSTLFGVSGQVFCQANEVETAPFAGVGMQLYLDSVADGVLDIAQDQKIAEVPGTAVDGRYSFFGLENGSYFVVVAGRADDEAAVRAFVIDSSTVDAEDIVLDVACGGPKAVDDEAEVIGDSVIIEVLLNDESADGVVNADELEILEEPVSINATLEIQEIQDRTVLLYTPSSAFRATATPENPAIDKFTYTLVDDEGRTDVATVTVEVRPEGIDCTDGAGADCLFVETEVEGIGVGRTPLLTCLLLLTLIVIRRYSRFATTRGDQS